MLVFAWNASSHTFSCRKYKLGKFKTNERKFYFLLQFGVSFVISINSQPGNRTTIQLKVQFKPPELRLFPGVNP